MPPDAPVASPASAPSAWDGALTLGHLLATAGVGLDDVVVTRHTPKPDGLSLADLSPATVLAYTREQGLGGKLGRTPPRHWLVFMAEGGRRCRLLAAYENHGEVDAARTDAARFFDLRPSGLLASMVDRLVIEWSRDPVNWAKTGALAAPFPVVKIADPDAVEFPGFDEVVLTHAELRQMVADDRFDAWHTALGSVQGVYLIADIRTGRLYVGQAAGQDRILGRWAQYAHEGHGGNKELRALTADDPARAEDFRYSILRVFGPSAPAGEVARAETHFKNALLSREHGLNDN